MDQIALHDTLSYINTHYGRGDIPWPLDIQSSPCGAKCVKVKLQFGIETPRFRIENEFVIFRGRKLQLKRRY